MRRLFGLILALAMIFCFVGCTSNKDDISGAEEPADGKENVVGKEYVGEWKANVATSLVDGVKTYSVFVIKLNEDGTGSYRDKDGTWVYNESENTVVLTLTDEKIGLVLEIGKDGEKAILRYYQDTYYRASEFTESTVSGIDGSTDVTQSPLLVSSDEYYNFLKTTGENAAKDTVFSKYSIGVGEYPYYEMVFVVNSDVADEEFYNAAEVIAKAIYDKIIAVAYETPPANNYSYNIVSIEFYTEANRNRGANCTYQLTIDELDADESFEKNTTTLKPQN